MYAAWADYVEEYGGVAVPEAAFDRVCRRAGDWLDALTFGRIDGVYAATAAVRKACCAVCDVLYADELAGGQAVARERLDSYEVAYAAGAGESLARRALRAARVYLWRTGLLSMAVKTGA